MKKNLYGFAIGVVAMTGLWSCSNDIGKEPINNPNGPNALFSPVRTPDVTAWSGTQDLSQGVMGTRSIQPGLTPPSVPYGSEEFNAVKDFFTKNDERFANEETPQGGKFLTIEEAFDGWENYWVQTLEEQSGDYDAYHTLNNLGIWNNFDSSWILKKWTEKGNEYFKGGEGDNIGHFKSIYNKNNAPWRLASPVKFENWPIYDFSYTTYLEDKWSQTVTGKYSYIFGKQPTVYRDSEDPMYGFYTLRCTPTPAYRIAQIDGYDEIYVAFYVQNLDYDKFLNIGDPESEASPLGTPDFGDGKWDVIIKLTQIKEDSYPGSPETPNENNGDKDTPDEPEEDETPDVPGLTMRMAPMFSVCPVDECGHKVHDGECDECKKEGKDIDCTTKASPATPKTSEVEVNLSILDNHPKYDITDLVTKLSIHVRYPRDVEVILPVPSDIYCDQDDLYILKDHYKDADGNNNYIYGGEDNMVTYEINGNTVELHVQFVTPENDDITAGNTGFIRVYTVGINDDVIAYLYKNFGDGINFEVFNYYNKGTQYTTGNYQAIESEDLQDYLNHSMVNFDWNTPRMAERVYPTFYIIGINELDKNETTGNGTKNEKDCYVWIIGDDRADNEFYNEVDYTYSPDLTLNWWSVEMDNQNPIFKDENERSFFWNAYQGTHYNSSKYNWIFTHKGVTGSVDPASTTNYPPMPESFPFE